MDIPNKNVCVPIPKVSTARFILAPVEGDGGRVLQHYLAPDSLCLQGQSS